MDQTITINSDTTDAVQKALDNLTQAQQDYTEDRITSTELHEAVCKYLHELETLRANLPAPRNYQRRVQDWAEQCFEASTLADITERCDRFMEEAIEFVQSLLYPAHRISDLTRYVYGRPIGDPAQEVGGTMVTLAVLCGTAGIDMEAASEAELTRIEGMIERIRQRQIEKAQTIKFTVS